MPTSRWSPSSLLEVKFTDTEKWCHVQTNVSGSFSSLGRRCVRAPERSVLLRRLHRPRRLPQQASLLPWSRLRRCPCRHRPRFPPVRPVVRYRAADGQGRLQVGVPQAHRRWPPSSNEGVCVRYYSDSFKFNHVALAEARREASVELIRAKRMPSWDRKSDRKQIWETDQKRIYGPGFSEVSLV